jgi:hypothetical protein
MSPLKVFVASVYAPSPWNRDWYKLQRMFLERNTQDVEFRFGILLNGVDASGFGADADVVGSCSSNAGHAAGMAELLAVFRKSDFSHFLFLDSDCFPVRAGWFSILRSQMERFRKRIAAPIRAENLDRFPHPCAFFCDSSVIQDSRIDFANGHAAPNILGETITDVGNAMLPLLPEILPLMRTNRFNRHPVAAGVYHHIFYHHGAGSRSFVFRLLDRYNYCEHWWPSDREELLAKELREELFSRPDEFVNSLM